jgi:hypothetical protein
MVVLYLKVRYKNLKFMGKHKRKFNIKCFKDTVYLKTVLEVVKDCSLDSSSMSSV